MDIIDRWLPARQYVDVPAATSNGDIDRDDYDRVPLDLAPGVEFKVDAPDSRTRRRATATYTLTIKIDPPYVSALFDVVEASPRAYDVRRVNW